MKHLNAKGSILLNALAATVIIAIISGVLLQQSVTTLKNLRLPRIKSVMTGVEGALRQSLLQPTSYDSCDSTVGFNTCTLKPAVITKLQTNIPGCVPGPCGVVVNGVYDSASRTFTGTTSYQGTDTPVNARAISVLVPVEILQSSTISCPDATPIFTGFNAAGVRQCRALEGSCGPGTFLTGFDPATLTAICKPLPSGAASCADTTSYINSFTWTSSSASKVCFPRPTPSSQFGP